MTVAVFVFVERKAVMKAQTRCSRPVLRWLAAGGGVAAALYATYAGFTWVRYGHPPRPASDETDRLLDQLLPAYEVVERHHVRVARQLRHYAGGGM